MNKETDEEKKRETCSRDIRGHGRKNSSRSNRRDVVDAVVKPRPGLISKLATDESGISLQLNETLAQEAFGTDDDGFIQGAMAQLSQMAITSSAIDPRALDFASSALVGIAPKNTLEAMLAVQIVANHIFSMKLAGQFMMASSIERQQALVSLYTKVARTFPAQLEILHRMRHGGQQRVVVEHVTVANGGQAVFGNIGDGGVG